MRSKSLLRLFVFVCLISISNGASCNTSNSKFMYNAITIVCENMTDKFPDSKSNVNSVVCVDCNIQSVDENTIRNFRGPTFNLSSSHIKEIKQNAFKLFTNTTRKFIFNDNEIELIAPKVFSNFSAIEDIILKNNRISRLEVNSFEGTNVSTLDLSHNILIDISSVFKGLRVTTLNLSSNSIRELLPSTFDGIIFWQGGKWKYGTQQLDLSKNALNKLLPSTFKFSNKDNVIRKLYLQETELSVIENDTFLELNYLWHLHLEGNHISQLYADSFKGLTMLNKLNLANNLLTALPNGIFGNLKALVMLDLSQNRLTTLSPITFTGLMTLTMLNVSHNNLQRLEEAHLVPLGKLTILDITNTRLHDLNLQAIMDHHYNLRTLILNDNFWICSKLVQIYKLMHRKGASFSYPSRHFDVPNLHGIACSRQEMDSYDNLSFEDFLSFISQDRAFEEIFDYNLQNESEGSLSSATVNDIHSIKTMFIVITIIGVLIFVHCIIKYVFTYLYRRNVIKNNQLRVVFGPKQDRVELLR